MKFHPLFLSLVFISSTVLAIDYSTNCPAVAVESLAGQKCYAEIVCSYNKQAQSIYTLTVFNKEDRGEQVSVQSNNSFTSVEIANEKMGYLMDFQTPNTNISDISAHNKLTEYFGVISRACNYMIEEDSIEKATGVLTQWISITHEVPKEQRIAFR